MYTIKQMIQKMEEERENIDILIAELKTIEENRQKAIWLYSPETEECLEHWTCSNCMHDIIENPRFKNRSSGNRTDFAFCPYCGIRMEDCEVE